MLPIYASQSALTYIVLKIAIIHLRLIYLLSLPPNHTNDVK